MRSFVLKLAGTLSALLAAVLVAVLVLHLTAAPFTGRGPTSSPTEEPSPTPGPSPTAAASVDELAAFAEIEAQVRELRGLPAPQIGPPEVIGRTQLAEEIQEILDETWTADELRRSNLMLRAMGLLDAEQDLRDLTEQLLSGQVLGFYDPADERMIVVSDAGLTPEARWTYAHEYTHALQDAAFEAFDGMELLVDDDAIGALQALTEGDATVVMFQWAFANLRPDELAEIGATPLPDTTGVPDWMIRQLEWPYTAGFTFVNALGGGSDWAAVDAAYRDPPVSTEQVIHPEKYADREDPVVVDAPEVARSLGAGWQDLEPNTVGEALIDIWLAALDASYSTELAAAGWGGDRMTVASGPNGAWAMAWRIAWDTATDADEFSAAYESVVAPNGMANELVRLSPTEVVVLHSSTTSDLETLAAELSE